MKCTLWQNVFFFGGNFKRERSASTKPPHVNGKRVRATTFWALSELCTQNHTSARFSLIETIRSSCLIEQKIVKQIIQIHQTIACLTIHSVTIYTITSSCKIKLLTQIKPLSKQQLLKIRLQLTNIFSN